MIEDWTMDTWKKVFADKLEGMNKGQSKNEIWRECWEINSGKQYFHRTNPDDSITVIDDLVSMALRGSWDSKHLFSEIFDLYPPIDDGKVHTWEMEDVSIEFVKVNAGVAWFVDAPNHYKLLVDFIAHHGSINVTGLQLIDFAKVFPILQEYKYSQDKPKYEVVWGKIMPVNGSRQFTIDATSTYFHYYQDFDLNIWTCEVLEK
jgi:hypothetical protein